VLASQVGRAWSIPFLPRTRVMSRRLMCPANWPCICSTHSVLSEASASTQWTHVLSGKDPVLRGAGCADRVFDGPAPELGTFARLGRPHRLQPRPDSRACPVIGSSFGALDATARGPGAD